MFWIIHEAGESTSPVNIYTLTTLISSTVYIENVCIITMASYEHHGVSNQRQLNCMFDSLFPATDSAIIKVGSIAALWGESNGFST